jgi:RimJ/RimL family protein N-acetyltransferase
VPAFLPEVLPAVEVGWRLDPDAWGQGYATEAAAAALDGAFRDLGLTQVISLPQVDNPASVRVAERLGMHASHTILAPETQRRGPVEIVVMELTSAEWLSRNPGTDPVRTNAARPRRARTEEAPYLADLWLRSRQASIPAIPPPVHSAADVRAWFVEVVVPTKEVWLVEEAAIPVALLILDGGWIDQLYVELDHAGRGFGSRLLELAKRLRPAGLDLWTFQSNHGARRFYERHGFEAVGTTVGDNEEGAPDVHYRWHGPAIS